MRKLILTFLAIASGAIAAPVTPIDQLQVTTSVKLSFLLSASRLGTDSSGNVIAAAAPSVSVTYSGTPVVSLPLYITPVPAVIPTTAGTGLPTVFSESSPPQFQVGFDIEEGVAPNGIGITSLSFNDMISGSSIYVCNCYLLASLSFPALVNAQAFHIVNLPLLTALSMPDLVETRLSPFALSGSGDLLVAQCPLLVTLSFPSLTTIGGGIAQSNGGLVPEELTGMTSMSFPVLTTVNGLFQPNNLPALTVLSFPMLATVTGLFSPSSMGALTTWNFPALSVVGGTFNPLSMASLTSLSCNVLTIIGGNATISSMAILTTVGLPGMVSYGGTIDLHSSNGNLTSVTLGTNGTLKAINGATINISGQKLTVANVNAILNLLVTLDGTNGTTAWGTGKTLTINGGTNGAPSGQGITDKATLIARGATVTTN